MYFDEMMPRPVANELIQRGHEVTMAVDVGMEEQPDPLHLAYATERELILVTQDKPFAGIASKRTDHSGVLCWNGAQNDLGGQIRALSDFAETHTPESVAGQVFWLK
ncbi:MAG: DUF5615 family PIN-like protein [Burkholderiaceae bacterium]|nr:DUF5615 family PIN-like protein [Burkholderiaceae bacterium]